MSLAVPAYVPMFPQLDAYLHGLAEKGAQPLPLAELNMKAPSLGPYVMPGGFYDLVCTPGPVLSVRVTPGHGRLLGVA